MQLLIQVSTLPAPVAASAPEVVRTMIQGSVVAQLTATDLWENSVEGDEKLGTGAICCSETAQNAR